MIRHFTSESDSDNTANIQGKFEEAVKKIYDLYNNEFLFSQNAALQELFSYYETEKYPGLGVIKKLSIKNHILINTELLSRL